MGYRPAEPVQSKPLLQRAFEERVLLAETALRKSEITMFDEAINLIAKDIEALPEESVTVREKWREKRAISAPGMLKAFAPGTVAMLRQTIAPLMQWRNIRGSADAHALDLLITRAQIAVLRKSADLADLKIDLLDRVSSLQMHLNPVREKAEVIKRVKSDAFWSAVTVADLEAIRGPLREIMHHRDRKGGVLLPAKVIDVTEDAAGVQTNRRATSLKTVDMKAYQQIVEAELKRHFDTNPTLKKIRTGEPVSEADIQALVSLVLIQSPNASREVLEEFFAETVVPLDFAIRSIVGLDPEAVAARFADFARRHPSLTAKQTRFLGLLQNHVARFGSVTLDRLYEQPFTVVDADGLDGVFAKPDEIDDLLDILSDFAPPSGARANNQESPDRTGNR